jgi:uncharacterized protein (TIGR02646 family)
VKALIKGPKPIALATNGQTWTTDFIAAHALDKSAVGHWGHDDIRDGLGTETNHKCAYCEGYVPDLSFEHVEHMLPKATFPELAHEWTNLTSACPRCNLSKGKYHEAGSEVLNPYVDDPEDHLFFVGNVVAHVKGSARGEITWRKLKLDRLELSHSRQVRIAAIRELFFCWREADEPLRGVLEEALLLDAVEGEFSTAVRSYLRAVGFPA